MDFFFFFYWLKARTDIFGNMIQTFFYQVKLEIILVFKNVYLME